MFVAFRSISRKGVHGHLLISPLGMSHLPSFISTAYPYSFFPRSFGSTHSSLPHKSMSAFGSLPTRRSKKSDRKNEGGETLRERQAKKKSARTIWLMVNAKANVLSDLNASTFSARWYKPFYSQRCTFYCLVLYALLRSESFVPCHSFTCPHCHSEPIRTM
jgi:hypothetical protein